MTCRKKNIGVILVLFFLVVTGIWAAPSDSDEAVAADFSAAFSRYRSGDYLAAAEQYIRLRELLQNDVRAQVACLMAARSYFDAKEYEKAYTLYTQFLDQYPDSPNVAEAMFMKARLLHETGRYR
ncbi:MAG: tetratricopeptide repeat protein, partial [Rectinema sp.]|nr:tetratricopeptide repeat protein [Rectinema sp.]